MTGEKGEEDADACSATICTLSIYALSAFVTLFTLLGNEVPHGRDDLIQERGVPARLVEHAQRAPSNLFAAPARRLSRPPNAKYEEVYSPGEVVGL